jgi:acetyltransferase-like isoleucine patch superfamily enzyme
MKVGEIMETKENKKVDRDEQKNEINNTRLPLRFLMSQFRSLSRSLCYLALKLKSKEIGSSIRCEGKLKISGTKNIKIGNRCHFDKHVELHTEGRGYIHLGENVKIGRNVSIFSSFNITVEDNTYIGDGVVFRDTFSESEKEVAQKEGRSVYIGKDVWIGKGTQIHAGVTIGHGATVSANSVVLRSIPPKVIAGGSPAKVIKEN